MYDKLVFEKDLGETLLMTSMFAIMPVLITFATTLTTSLTNAISTMGKFIITQIELYWISHKKCNIVSIEYNEPISCTTREEDGRKKFLINSVLDYITKNNIYSPKMACIVNEALAAKTSKAILKNRKNILIPQTAIQIDNFKIDTCKTESDKAISFKMTISHPTSTKEIHNFLNMCVSVYVDDCYKTDNNQYFYELCKNGNNCTYYSKYNISNNETTFDTIFFPEKQKIIELLDKLNDGKLRKLSLLLDGEPGVGKTSIIKAIAKRTGYSIISVKLSVVRSDHHFRNIFHNSMVGYYENNIEKAIMSYDVVPLDKRIYILEDIDAESHIVHSRSCTNDEPVVVRPNFFEKENDPNRSTLTLSGILNTLDGMLEISKAIIIMTTNHKEKLDEALIRPGRITLSLRLTKMTSEYANMLINYIYGQSIDIEDGVFTPATLMSLCHTTSDIDELKDLISRYTKTQ